MQGQNHAISDREVVLVGWDLQEANPQTDISAASQLCRRFGLESNSIEMYFCQFFIYKLGLVKLLPKVASMHNNNAIYVSNDSGPSDILNFAIICLLFSWIQSPMVYYQQVCLLSHAATKCIPMLSVVVSYATDSDLKKSWWVMWGIYKWS